MDRVRVRVRIGQGLSPHDGGRTSHYLSSLAAVAPCIADQKCSMGVLNLRLQECNRGG